MTRSIGTTIPDALASRLDGADPAAQEGFTALLVTAEPNGWPHVAMLSAGEMLVAEGRVWLALWPTSTATDRLTRTGRGLLHAIVDDDSISLRLACRRGPSVGQGEHGLATFACDVDEVFNDKVGYARITSGITFQLTRRATDLPRWQETIAALRDIAQREDR